MKYELAKELKEANYPQKFVEGRVAKVNVDNTEYCFEPTLSELIEACGDRFKRVALHMKYYKTKHLNWSAHWRVNFKGKLGVVWGRSPEEAVARLWLELNKK